MATELISGPLTDIYEVDYGDIVTVTATGSVIGKFDNVGAISSRSVTDSHVSLFIDGTIENTGDYGLGIMLSGQAVDAAGEPDGFNLIHVRETGDVQAYVGIGLYYGQSNSIIVDGYVHGAATGIHVLGENVSITVTGTVASSSENFAAIFVDSSELVTINNSGTLTGQYLGVEITDTNDALLTNTGTIFGETVGIHGYTTENFRIVNSGTISGGDGGVLFARSDAFDLNNTGQITGVEVNDSNGNIENSGDIIGDGAGLLLFGFGVGVVTSLNTGLIKGDYSVLIYSGSLHLTNLGTLKGNVEKSDVMIRSGQVTLINGGDIFGNVKLGSNNDTYLAQGDGNVSKYVSGRDGNDSLTGAKNDDDLRGNLGDDVLKGQGGNDILQGGQGDDQIFGGDGNDNLIGHIGNDTLTGGKGDDTLAGNNDNDDLDGGQDDDILDGGSGQDTLTGGKGNDTLTGGKGNDVFVFAANSGSDRIEDFTSGADHIELSDHSGGFGSLGIQAQGADLQITYDGGMITLTGLAGLTLTQADFDFI